jgi:hypothetical protein
MDGREKLPFAGYSVINLNLVIESSGNGVIEKARAFRLPHHQITQLLDSEAL